MTNCVVCYEHCDGGGPPEPASRGQSTAKILLHLFDQQLSSSPINLTTNWHFNCCSKCYDDLTRINRIFEEIEALLGQLSRAREKIGASILTSFSRVQNQHHDHLNLDNLMTDSIREEIVKALKPIIDADADVKEEIVDDQPADDIFDHGQNEEILNSEFPEVSNENYFGLGSPTTDNFSTNSEAGDKITSKVDQLSTSGRFSKYNQNEQEIYEDNADESDDDDNDSDFDYKNSSTQFKRRSKVISYERKKKIVQGSLDHPKWKMQTLCQKYGINNLTTHQLQNWKILVEKTELARSKNKNDGEFVDPFIKLPPLSPPPPKRKSIHKKPKVKEVIEIDYELLKKDCFQNVPILSLLPVPYDDVLNSTSINEKTIKEYIQNDRKELREIRILKRKRIALKSNLFVVKKSSNQDKNCPHCSYSSCVGVTLRKHILAEHPDTEEAKSIKICMVCQPPINFLSEQMFDTHNRKFHSDEPYFEPIPRIIQSDDNVKKFLCVLCNKSFISIGTFRIHCTIVHNKILKTCIHCNKSIPSHRLSKHIASNHPSESEKNSECPTCFKVFSSLWRLKRHQSYVHKVKLACKFCKKTFTSHENRNHHELRHEGKFDCLCVLCGKAFISMNGVRSHMKIVHGEKKPCPHCSKSINEHNLEFHIKQFHEKVHNFFCHVCSAGFFRIRELNVHLKKHSKDVDNVNSYP